MTEKKQPEVIEDAALDEASGGIIAVLVGVQPTTSRAQSQNNLKQIALAATPGDGSV